MGHRAAAVWRYGGAKAPRASRSQRMELALMHRRPFGGRWTVKRLWILLMVLAATAVVAAAAYAGSQRAATHATGSVRVLKTYAVGPFADCDFDSCGIGGVSPVTITIPEDTRPYRAVI